MDSNRPQPPNLLNDDGTASMATMLLMSHHAFRRDIARLIQAVGEIQSGETSRLDAVRDEWQKSYCLALHGHHTAEDTRIFPQLRKDHPELATAIDTLMEQHHLIDPIIEKGNAAFADLTHPDAAEAVLHDLKTLLDKHLTFEEAEITPALREMREFPTPANEAAAAQFSQGFAWSMQGIAPHVLEQVEKMLPEILLTKLPAARAAFEERSKRTWETYVQGSATASIPDGYQ
jgi:hypothetical protein